MENTVRWSVVVSKDTDISLRTFLAQHGMRKGDLSKFVEEAVRWRVLDRAVAKTKAKNAHVSAEERRRFSEERSGISASFLR